VDLREFEQQLPLASPGGVTTTFAHFRASPTPLLGEEPAFEDLDIDPDLLLSITEQAERKVCVCVRVWRCWRCCPVCGPP
jgi:hypothetical protein